MEVMFLGDSLRTRIGRAWNAFRDTVNDIRSYAENRGSVRLDRKRLSFGNERSIIASIYNRLGMDVASISVQHIRVDENGRYKEDVNSYLNDCLTRSANVDQTGRAFVQDAAMSLFDEGAIAIVPVETSSDPTDSDAFDVHQLRVGKITEWFPQHVTVDLYDERTGRHQTVTLPKRAVAIVENPLYAVMNEHNSTLQRLIRKLNLLDVVDEQSSSGKLDILIQLPFLLKGERKKEQAEERRRAITDQLRGSEYGVAYTDATEKITQLNRPVENNLLKQVEYLTSMLYSQLGLTTSVMDGTADEATMINYYKRTIEPISMAIVDAMERTFLSRTAYTQGQRIATFYDPFKLVPMSVLAEMIDKFGRNKVLTSNESRGIIGFKPVKDEGADALSNDNLYPTKPEPTDALPNAKMAPTKDTKGGEPIDAKTEV